MAELSEKLQRWEETRKMGLVPFVLVYGVLAWGLSTGVIWAVVMSVMSGWEKFFMRLLVACIFFPIGGVLFGFFVWRKNEQEFLKQMPDPNNPETNQ